MRPTLLAAVIWTGLVAPAISAPDAAENPTTIAVLDFVNRRPGDGRDWLGKGLADMVITDLSASGRLTVVDRERMQQLAREFDLAAAGILDESTAPEVGRIAKAGWVLQGTFACRDGRIAIEALLIDVTGHQVLRIEQAEGPLDDVFKLEGRLIGRVLENLDVPMTEAELRRVKLLRTESLPAFEHYSRSLVAFDGGEWYAALQEARLARRADPGYLMAAARVAQLYHELGEPEHALVEYRRLVRQDEQNSLPDEVYFRMAVVLDEAMADRASAEKILQRILNRSRDQFPPFDVTAPSRLSHVGEGVGGKVEVDRIAEQNKTRLRTLARLAHWHAEAGDHFEAAQLRSRMRYFLYSHGMPFGHDSLHFWATNLRATHSGGDYWRLVRENRDRTLYPGTVHLLSHGETVDAKTEPTHGYYKWHDHRFWLAPPDHEIAKVSYRVGSPATFDPTKINRPPQIDFSSPEGYHSLLFEIVKVAPDGKWHELKLDRGVRAIKTYVFHDTRWQMRFELRRWTGPVEVPRIGGLQVHVLPEGAEPFHNGKSRGHVKQGLALLRIPAGEYTVEARWPDGRRRSAVVQLEEGRRVQVWLNADLKIASRKVVALRGSYPSLLTDRAGRFWLVWDEHDQGSIMDSNKESSIYCATSPDGLQWSRPRRLPVSSLSCDFAPILRQDRRGVYWLIWISERGPKAEKNLWIASSSNGVEWSFPRKVALPVEVQGNLAGWREGRLPYIAFTIDSRNVFWLIWHGWLLRSDDAAAWQVDAELRTGANSPDRVMAGEHYHLTCDAAGRLVLLTSRHGGSFGAELWRRSLRGDWASIDHLTDGHSYHAGSVACRRDGSMLAVTPHGADLYVHEFGPEGSGCEPVAVESYLSKPYHPAIAPLADGRWLVAFGSSDGIVATVVHKEK